MTPMMTIRILALCITAALCSGCLNTSLLTGSVVRADFEGVGSLYLESEHFEYYKEFYAQYVALGEKDWPMSEIEDAQCRNAERYLEKTPTPSRAGAQSLLPLMKLAREQDCRATEERVAASIVRARAENGIGFPEGQEAYDKGDYATAMKYWLPLAVYADHTRAQHNVGLLFEEGKADNSMKVCSDPPAGTDLERRSCFEPPSLPIVGAQSANPIRIAAAIKWYGKAAAKGFADSQYKLGVFEVTDSMGWLHKAAEQGHADAQAALGFRYGTGKGVPKDLAKAAVWYRRAAEQGNAQASKNLAIVNREMKQEKLDLERQKRIARMCPKGVADFGKLLVINPYDVKGRCYGFVGQPIQILSRNTGLYQLGRKTAYIDFGRDAAPGQFFQGYVKGVGVYTYTDTRGAKIIAPSFVAIDLPPKKIAAGAAD